MLLALLLGCSSAVIPVTGAVTVTNPSFEEAGGGGGGWTGESGMLKRGSSELFAPYHGASYADVQADSSVAQALVGTVEAGRRIKVTVWARTLNAHIPDTAPGTESRGMQKTHPKLLAKAKLTLSDSTTDAELASAEITVSPNASVVVTADGKPGVNAQDDGANVFIAGGYRVHVGNSFLYVFSYDRSTSTGSATSPTDSTSLLFSSILFLFPTRIPVSLLCLYCFSTVSLLCLYSPLLLISNQGTKS